MAKKQYLDEVNNVHLVYNTKTKQYTRNGKPIKEGYKYYDTKDKLLKTYRNGSFITENDKRFANDTNKRIKRNLLKTITNIAFPSLGPVYNAIDLLANIGATYSGGSPIPDGTKYTGLHRFGNNEYTSITKNRSTILSGKNSKGKGEILNYYLNGIDTGLNRSKQEPIRVTGSKDFDYPNVDYNFLPVDTLTLTDDFKPKIDSLVNQGFKRIDNWYNVDDNDEFSINLRNNRRYKDRTVYDYGRARGKFLKDKNGNYLLRTFDKFDTGKTTGPLGIALEHLKDTYPLIVRHDNPIKFIKKEDANYFNQDNDLLYNIMFRR